MRLRYMPNPPTNLAQEEEQIVQEVLERRGSLGLLALDMTLLHSPQVTAGWHSFFGAIRTTTIKSELRSLAICRVALLNRARYQWDGHSAALLACEGFNHEKMEVVKTLHPAGPGPLDETQWTVLRYADAMTRDIVVDDDLFTALKSARFSDGEIVELTVIVAAYNCVSRFLVALDVGERNSQRDNISID
jgi:alkylhydroperoxidase family enzyme